MKRKLMRGSWLHMRRGWGKVIGKMCIKLMKHKWDKEGYSLSTFQKKESICLDKMWGKLLIIKNSLICMKNKLSGFCRQNSSMGMLNNCYPMNWHKLRWDIPRDIYYPSSNFLTGKRYNYWSSENKLSMSYYKAGKKFGCFERNTHQDISISN